jgi:hypothetical protein
VLVASSFPICSAASQPAIRLRRRSRARKRLDWHGSRPRSTAAIRSRRPRRWRPSRAKREFAGWILSLVTIDPAALDDTVERVNITLPRRVLRRLDDQARAAGETRSGYVAKLAIGR